MVEPGAVITDLGRSNVANNMAENEGREPDNPSAKGETKQPSGRWKRLRNNRAIAFLLESYRELRYKVTWPTFQEARSMTIIVISLSAAVSAFLTLEDTGLFRLFQLITGGK
jgi:preprotein translocase SecE subunit